MAWARWDERAARPVDPAAIALLDALFGNSPYLTETALQSPGFMTDLWRHGPDAAAAGLLAELAAVRQEASTGATPAEIASRLRRLKRRVALAVMPEHHAVARDPPQPPSRLVGQQVCEHDAVAFAEVAALHRNPIRERGAGVGEGMKLAVLA